MKSSEVRNRPARTAGISHSDMLSRALLYGQLATRRRDRLTPAQIAEKYNESIPTVYKLIRMAKVPSSVHELIREKKVTATEVSNLLRSNMSDQETIDAVNELVAHREKGQEMLNKAGFEGKSMTLRRKVTLAITGLKRRRLLSNERSKQLADLLDELVSNEQTVESIQRRLLGA